MNTGPTTNALDMIRLLKRSMGEPENLVYSEEPEDAFDEDDDEEVAKRAGMVRLLRSQS